MQDSSFDPDRFLEECLGAQFTGADISKNRKNDKFTEHEAVLTIKSGKDSHILDVSHLGSKIEDALVAHRVAPITDFIANCMIESFAQFEVSLDCHLIFNIYDNIAAGSDSSRDLYTVGFSGPLPAQTLFMPDPHFLGFLRNPINDPIPFGDKKDGALFRGSDTNIQRINLSVATQDMDFFDCKISRFIPNAFTEAYKEINKSSISADWMGLDEQLQYKYILDPHGWTRGWDRAYWVLKSNSILVSVLPDDGIVHQNWYSRFMYDHDIVPLLTYEQVLDPASFPPLEEYNKKQQDFGRMLMERTTIKAYVINFILSYNRGFNA